MGRGCYGSWLRSCAASIKNLNEEKNVDRAGTSHSVIKGAHSLCSWRLQGCYPASSVLLMSPHDAPGNVMRPVNDSTVLHGQDSQFLEVIQETLVKVPHQHSDG